MTSEQLKTLLNEDLVKTILEAIGCNNIHKSNKVIQCSNPDGDNKNAVSVYLDNFMVADYTRPKFQQKKYKDIVTFVEFIENLTYPQAMKRICDICNFNYYEKAKRVPSILKWLEQIEHKYKKYDDEIIVPLPERVLNQFNISPVKKWRDEGILSKIQNEFQIGLDLSTERIVIPIRDELGALVGVKGRLLTDNIVDDKYIYIYSCPKTKILFGLYYNYQNIIDKNEVIVVESEKSVLKLRSLGFNNAVAIGGKTMSKQQLDKLIRLQVPITLALDKDVTHDEIMTIVNELKYPFYINDIYAIEDDLNLLSAKESPMDDGNKWEILYNQFKKLID